MEIAIIRKEEKYFLAVFLQDLVMLMSGFFLIQNNDPCYKQVPDFEFLITVDDIEKVKKVKDVSEKIVKELEFRVKTINNNRLGVNPE